MKSIKVVAAVFFDRDRIFATRRGYGEQKGKWEFPGGKVEPGEEPEAALKREIREELDTEIRIDSFITDISFDYPNFHMDMKLYRCSVVSGALTLKEAMGADWLTLSTLRKADWLPADRLVLDLLEEMMLEEKRKLAEEVISRLKKEYPDTHCTLAYDKAWQLLVSVRLAAQCTDLRVDQTTPLLYAKFPTVAALAEAPVSEIEEIVRPCGLGPSKARDISACMKVLHEKYDDQVPEDFEELLALPGVGRKSANLVMGDVFGKPAIVTDTHCIRLSNLIGLVDDVKEPAKVEKLLWKIIPAGEGNELCHRFVDHGRAVCVARRPRCEVCCLRDICRYGSAGN